MPPRQNQTMPSNYRILSIDGGGLRGIIPLAILENLDRAKPGWRAGINMYAGTSTGGLIALALAKGMSPRDIMDVYLGSGKSIFDRSVWHTIADLNNTVGPKYASDNRETVVRGLLGNARLEDYLSKDGASGHVLIAAFDLHRWKPKLFHNMPTNDESDDGGALAYRVAMATSAAPTYFSSYDGCVDGGVFANNPAMCALAQTQDARNRMSIPMAAVRMLSLGTGVYPQPLKQDEESWGLAQWAPELVSVLTDGVLGVADYQVRQTLGADKYVRLSTTLDEQIAMDDTSKLGMLQRIGDDIDVSTALALINRW